MRLRVRARTLLSLVTVTLLATVGVLLGGARPAAAHNSLVSTDPSTGAVLDAAPTRASFLFDKAVPLETASVQLIDASGARVDLTGLAHGPAGDTELVAPLPTLAAGDITLRWRLVGPDGHPLTDRVTFTVRTSAPNATVAPVVGGPEATPTAPTPTTSAEPPSVAADDAQPAVPGPARWLLRFASYVAIMTLIGIVLADGLVWPGAIAHPRLASALSWATIAVLVVGALQLLVLASDIAGGLPGLGDLEVAGRTPAGGALVLRLLLGAGAGVLLRSPGDVHPETRWSVLSLLGLGLLGTWAFAGHAASQRWPHLGVSLDVLHHLAAALWIGSLAVVGFVATAAVEPVELSRVFRRLSRWAAVAVVGLVVTGLAQSVRLVGGPSHVFGTGHGRYLALKLLVLAVMLAVASANRRRVRTRLARTEHTRTAVAQLRRGVLSEVALGVVIIGVTAAMVVAPPGASL